MAFHDAAGEAGPAHDLLTAAIVLVTVMGLAVAFLLKRWYGYG